MYQERSRGGQPSEGLDGEVAAILLRLLGDASHFVDRDACAAHACLDRASALLESERSRAARRSAVLLLGERRPFLAPWQVARVTAYLSDYIDSPIELTELARLTRLTANQFSAAFKVSFGMSVQDYIDLRRMNLACIMMLTTDRPLCQIVKACGLLDQAEFSRLFKQTFGQAPKTWRGQRRGLTARL